VITHQTVKDAPCLLGIHLVFIDGARFLDGGPDGCRRDLVEDDAAYGHVFVFLGNGSADMVGDGFSFPVIIRGQEDGAGFFCGLLQILQQGSLATDGQVFRHEIMVDIHPKP